MTKHFVTSLRAFIVLTLVCGVAYPLSVQVIALLAPAKANGSLITATNDNEDINVVIGAVNIGQSNNAPQYFWPRPSATTPPYNAGLSSSSNVSVISPEYAEIVRERIAVFKAAHPDNKSDIPMDMVTASASGLDPHISVASAEIQAARVAKKRGISLEKISALIKEHTDGKQLGVLGQERVNVLQLNIALDKLSELDKK